MRAAVVRGGRVAIAVALAVGVLVRKQPAHESMPSTITAQQRLMTILIATLGRRNSGAPFSAASHIPVSLDGAQASKVSRPAL
jgi:hypothetical protein